MGRKRNPERDKSMERWLESGGKVTLDELAKIACVSKDCVRRWKMEDDWKEKLKEISSKKKGGQKGNQNASGRTPAKDGNQNAVTHGIYRKKGLEELTKEKVEQIRQTVQGSSLQRMQNELESLLKRKAYLEGLLEQYTNQVAEGEFYVDKVIHMVVPKKMEEMQEEQQKKKTKIEQIKDPEGSREKLKTSVKTIIKSSAFERAMKVEAELNRLHGRIIKQLDSMKAYEMEWQRLSLEERKYILAKQKLTGEIELEDETEEIIDEEDRFF